MTSKVIQTKTGNQILYKIIKDGYKTITQTIDVVDSFPTRNVYNLEPSSVIHNPELNYTIDTDHTYPPTMKFNENIVTPDDTEITTNEYILAPYGQEYVILDNQGEDNFTRVGNVKINKDGVANNFSSTNYLQLQENENIKELIVKVKTNNSFDTSGYRTITEGNLYIGQYSNTFCFWNPVTSSMVTFYSNVQYNTYYWIKAKIEDSSLVMSYSTDGENFTQGWSGNANKTSVCFSMIGYSPYNSYFLGDIYLQDFKFFDSNQNEIWELTWDRMAHNYMPVGALPIEKNIANNFTTSQYIRIFNFQPGSQPWEITTKLYLTSNSGTQVLFGSCDNRYYCPYLYLSDGKFHIYMSGNGSSWNIANNLSSTLTVSTNTWHRVSLIWTGSVYRVVVDGTTHLSFSSSTKIMRNNYPLCIGNYINNSSLPNAKIDLSQTYIKVNNKKVWSGSMLEFIDLGEMSGYVVLNNNILTGFNGNYLYFTKNPPQPIASYEVVLKWKTDSFNDGRLIGNYNGNIYSIQVEVPSSSENKMWWGHPSSDHNWQAINPNYIVTTNTWYWVKGVYDSTTSTVTVYMHKENEEYRNCGEFTVSGCGWSRGFEIGSDEGSGNLSYNTQIDLSESYIKINDEYYWKGTEVVANQLPGILDPEYNDTGDETIYKLYDVETDGRYLVLNDNRNTNIPNVKFTEYNGEITIPDHGLSIYDPENYTWSKYRIITLNVNNEDTSIYTEGDIE